MIILGLDPGSTRIGYGLVKKDKGNLTILASGLLKIFKENKNERLMELEKDCVRLIKKYKPDLVAIEKLYFVKNVKTGIEVAQSRGILTLIIIKHKIPLLEYTPLEVKQMTTGYGLAEKEAVQRSVMKILKIKKFVGGDDAADALAIAITAAHQPLAFTKI